MIEARQLNLNGFYTPEYLFGDDARECLEIMDLETFMDIECSENGSSMTIRDLDKIWFVGTITGGCRLLKGFIFSAIYAIGLVGQLFIYRETRTSLRNSFYGEIKNIQRGFIALFPIIGGIILIHLENQENRQNFSEDKRLDINELDREFRVDEDDFLAIEKDLLKTYDLITQEDDLDDDDETITWDMIHEIEAKFQELSNPI